MTTFASLIGYNVRAHRLLLPGARHVQPNGSTGLHGLMHPRALQVMLGRQDPLFQPSGMHAAVNTIAAVYEKAGCPEKFSCYGRPSARIQPSYARTSD